MNFSLPGTLRVLVDGEVWSEELEGHDPLWSIDDYLKLSSKKQGTSTHYVEFDTEDNQGLEAIAKYSTENLVVVLRSGESMPVTGYRKAIEKLEGVDIPLIVRNQCDEEIEKFTLHSSIDTGALLIDRKLHGVWLEGEKVSLLERNRLSFGILQATRTRISKTEYISCPSCGRTLFDLEETTAKSGGLQITLRESKLALWAAL